MNAADLRAAVCSEARRWIGTPWHHRQRALGAGVDCAHLLIAVYAACGLLIADEVVDMFIPVRFYWVRRHRWLKLHGSP